MPYNSISWSICSFRQVQMHTPLRGQIGPYRDEGGLHCRSCRTPSRRWTMLIGFPSGSAIQAVRRSERKSRGSLSEGAPSEVRRAYSRSASSVHRIIATGLPPSSGLRPWSLIAASTEDKPMVNLSSVTSTWVGVPSLGVLYVSRNPRPL